MLLLNVWPIGFQRAADAFFAELERVGEEEVRLRLARQTYGDAGGRRQLAQEWLSSKERARTAVSNAEIASTASRAATAAELAAAAAKAQARTAKQALITAIAATTIAAVALIVSILVALHIMS